MTDSSSAEPMTAQPFETEPSETAPTLIGRLVSDYRVLVCGGSGGVGKTTVAAALGVGAAQQGKRVLVLTVDPARRLANALGLDRIDDQRVEIATSGSGQLWISVLRPERIFEHFIDQARVTDAEKRRLKQNRLFRQLSTTLSGSQEFTSLLWLQQLDASGDYDLIVVDTPPSDHAIDFLYAPERIAALFEGAVAKFFVGRLKQMGLLGTLMVGTTQLWLKALSKLTGAEFIAAVSDLVASVGPFSDLISARSRAAEALLKSEQAAFLLVASPDPAKLLQGQAFHADLQRAGYQLQGLIINRAYPCWVLNPDQAVADSQAALYHQMRRYFSRRIERVRRSALVQQSQLAMLELPELTGTLAGLDALQQLADYLFREPANKSKCISGTQTGSQSRRDFAGMSRPVKKS